MTLDTLSPPRNDTLFLGNEFDLNAYLRRVGYSGPRTATIATLRELHQLHPEAIPVENLDPLVGRPIDLDIRALERKLVQSQRGGYSIEHNFLFGHALHSLGFSVRVLAARSRWQVPEDMPTPRDHLLLLVDQPDGPYIADVGFPGMVLLSPLRLLLEVVQTSPREEYCLQPRGASLELRVRLGTDWQPLYQFDLSPQLRPDFEVVNYYLSQHPESPLRRQLQVARIDGTTRYSLRDNYLSVHLRDGTVKRRKLEDEPSLRSTLKDLFHIAVPADAALETRLRQIFE